MKQPRYILRIEGCFLYDSINDTQDLATQRGVGLSLLWATDDSAWDRPEGGAVPPGSSPIWRLLQNIVTEHAGDDLETLSKGASIGIYRFQAPSDGVALSIAEELRRRLRNPQSWKQVFASPSDREALGVLHSLRHLRLEVAVLPDQEFVKGAKTSGTAQSSYSLGNEALVATNRWRQLETPSVVPPSRGSEGTRPCGINGILPGSEARQYYNDDPVNVSSSVLKRRTAGREAKRSIFIRAGSRFDSDPASKKSRNAPDLASLCKNPSMGRLNGKMAVIYADGNDFGKTRRESVQSWEDLQRWDACAGNLRTELIDNMLQRIRPSSKNSDADGFPFEVLLWGGDELCWVVPAWWGWAAVESILEVYSTQSFAGRDSAGQSTNSPLRVKLGVVFCQANTPIRRARSLAGKIADLAKDHRNKLMRQKDTTPNDKTQLENRSWVAYQVLESVDHLGTNSEEQIRLRTPGGAASSDSESTSLILDSRQVLGSLPEEQEVSMTVREALDVLHRNSVPHRGVVRCARAALQQGFDPKAGSAPGDQDGRTQPSADQKRVRLNAFEVKPGGQKVDPLSDLTQEAQASAQEALECLGAQALATASEWKPYLAWIHAMELWDYLDPSIVGPSASSLSSNLQAGESRG